VTPPPATANPNWNIGIFNLFEQFKNPLVYTPGDNEWTDCHKTNEGTSGDPLKELAAVRSLFFPEPGYTLGGRKKRVLTQAESYDPSHRTDHKFVDGLDGYTVFVKTLAALAVHFERPVLLINGDSHVFGADQPLADPNSATGKIHKAQAVPNLTRITVQGSVNTPSEWLRLTIDPHTRDVFSWENVVYLP
jgi:hypothetical protein